MRIREKLTSTDWAAETLQTLKAELDRLQAAGSLEIPKEPGGWWHQYVCPNHHTELEFDPAERDARTFACPHGCRIEGEAYRGAWLVFKHQSIARCALQAAAVYAGTGEQTYADLAKRILVSYAEQFPNYPVHPDAQPWMLKGRAFHQALTEAIWATTLLRAYVLLHDEGAALGSAEQAVLDRFLSMLEESMTQYRHILIHERSNAENNYTAWLNAALCCVYTIRGQREQLEALIEDEGGWKHHLTIGVKPDQLEFEGSTYYHIFVLRAYLIAAEMAARFSIDLYHTEGGQGQSMKGMFDVLVGLSDDQGVLPALHDGPLARVPFAREIAEIMEIGLAVYGNEAYIPILGEAYRQMDGEPRRISLEALVYGEGDAELSRSMPSRPSLLLADSGFVVGRSSNNGGLSFLADFGPHGGSHGHYDKLHLSLQHTGGTITPDLGMVPYGSELRKEWFADTASHNTVSIDGKSQAAHEGRCRQFTDNGRTVYAWLQSDAAYEGARLDRHLLLTDEWLLDWYEVNLDSERTIDWWMHALIAPEAAGGGCGSLRALEAAEAVTGYTESGYSHIRLLDRYEAGGEAAACDPVLARLRYRLNDAAAVKDLLHTAILFEGDTLYRIETPGTTIDPSEKLTGLLHRRKGRSARFIHIYQLGSEPACNVRWQSSDGSVGASSLPGRLIIETSQGRAVCELDSNQGLIVQGEATS
ncbi:heparinase II/III domain-containing protein [Paenibacillus piri]|uniref:Heparinase n=1 Tax=Paenibacillus piri TaxID=2547395 RepID=A0A4R5KMW3_9BACL|nr:heparinase II/III family protein [Paenibacillus piri]TDF96572.1 heparinase [Paenibacillus piri]